MTPKKIVLKLSGEVLAGAQTFGLSPDCIQHYTEEVISTYRQGYAVALIVGGGNIWRGSSAQKLQMKRTQADHMGMLATMINAIALHHAIEKEGIRTHLMTRLGLPNMAEYYSPRKAKHYLERGELVILGGGTNNPCFTTDSAGSLTAVELDAHVFIKGTNVDGVYDKDPNQHADAKKYSHLSLQEAVDQKLGVMDMTAIELCQQNQIEVIVYNATIKGQLSKVLEGKQGGTFLHP